MKASAAAARDLHRRVEQLSREQQARMQRAQQLVAHAEGIQRDREIEAKLEKIRGELQLEFVKQQSLNEMRARKTEDQAEIRRNATAHNLALAAQRQAEELRRAQEKHEVELAIRAQE